MKSDTRHKFKAQLAAIVSASALFLASQAKADGVVLIKDYPDQSPQYWKTFSFSKIEEFPASYTITRINGQQQVFTRDRVGSILQEPKWEELILTSDTHWQTLDLQKSKFLSAASQFPQLKAWASAIGSKFDTYLTQNSPSTVVYRGKFISRDDWNKLRGIDTPTSSTSLEKGVISELTIGAVKLTNVKLKSFNDTRVSLVHSNGIQGYNLADLKEAEISSLGKAFPEFAEYIQELNVSNVNARTPSSALSEGKKENQSMRGQVGMTSTKDTSAQTGGMTPSSESKEGGLHLNSAEMNPISHTQDLQLTDKNRKASKSAAETQITQLSDTQKQAELSNRIRGLRLKVEVRAISSQCEMLKSSALSEGKKENQSMRGQVGMTSTKDTSAQTGGMTPSSESKEGGLHLNLPSVEHEMLSANQKRQLEHSARAFGKDPNELIRQTNELARKIQHDMMYPEDRGLREREESRRKSGFYGPGK